MKGKPWMGSFEAKDDGDLVIKQIKHNCDYWGSQMCKRDTLEKYCREKGVQDPTTVINMLINAGIVYKPKKGYVAFTKPKVTKRMQKRLGKGWREIVNQQK